MVGWPRQLLYFNQICEWEIWIVLKWNFFGIKKEHSNQMFS